MRTLLWSVVLLNSVMVPEAGNRVEVIGEVSFQLMVFDPADRTWKARADGGEGRGGRGDAELANAALRMGRGNAGGGVTAAERLECEYQFPEQRHLDAMLSSIMNRLTKLFMRLRQRLAARQNEKKRFRVVDKRDNILFDRIYADMSDHFRHSVNQTRFRAPIEPSDPCAHQAEIRALWGRLLDTAERSLGRAAYACIKDYMQASRAEDLKGDSGGEGGGGAAGKGLAAAEPLIMRELRRVRDDQLQLLCDRFQLCYHDLQRPRRSRHARTTSTTGTASDITITASTITDISQ